MVFMYCIVPEDGSERDALIRANLYAATVEIAKEHVRARLTTAPLASVAKDFYRHERR
jgi:hypothetical protein